MDSGLRLERGDLLLTVGEEDVVYVDETPFHIARVDDEIVVKESKGGDFVVIAKAKV